MTAWAAIVSFGVSERVIDELIEAVHGSAAEPRRWFVFGFDISLLGALHEQWNGAIDLTIGHLPATDSFLIDAICEVVELEGIVLDRCAWLHGKGLAGAAPPLAGLVVEAGDLTSAELAKVLADSTARNG